MGNTTSQNVIDDTVNIVHNTVNNTMMTNSQSVSQVAGIRVKAKGDVVISHITIDQTMKVMQTSAMNASTKAKFNDDISQNMKQAAEAVKQALSLNPGSAHATNITSMMTDLATNVSNTFSMIDKQQLDQAADLEVDTDKSATIQYISITQLNNTIMNTVLTSSAVQDTMLKLAQTVSQTAKAKEESLFSGLMIVVLVILGGGMLFGKKLLNPKFLLPVGGVAGGAFWYMSIYRPEHPKTN